MQFQNIVLMYSTFELLKQQISLGVFIDAFSGLNYIVALCLVFLWFLLMVYQIFKL